VTGRPLRKAAGAVMVAALLLTGCQKVTRKVTSSVSPCFRILPAAHQAVGGQGTFVDVARIRGTGADRFPRPKTAGTTTTAGLTTTSAGATTVPQAGTTTTVAHQNRDICVVAYRGTFDPARITDLRGAQQGRYALVVVGVRSRLVRLVLLTNKLPPPLHGH
jgi:hypothetical protein